MPNQGWQTQKCQRNECQMPNIAVHSWSMFSNNMNTTKKVNVDFQWAHPWNPVTRNRTRDHLIAAWIYSQMLYQLSYDRLDFMYLSYRQLVKCLIAQCDQFGVRRNSQAVDAQFASKEMGMNKRHDEWASMLWNLNQSKNAFVSWGSFFACWLIEIKHILEQT